MSEKKGRLLAISSGGGHWIQLMRLAPAFDNLDVAYATVDRSYATHVQGARFYCIPDASMWSKVRLLWMACCILWLVIRERPRWVVSTGAAPGYFALLFGRWFGARTVWIDSIANGEELSLAGRRAGKVADLWLTQWPELTGPSGPHYKGSVL